MAFVGVSRVVCVLGAALCVVGCQAEAGEDLARSDSALTAPFAGESTVGHDANFGVLQGRVRYLRSYQQQFGRAYGDVAGRGQVVRRADGTTTASVSVSGLPVGTFFAAHLHRAPCAEDAGPHWQRPDECPYTNGSNTCDATYEPDGSGTELFLSGTSDASGRLAVQGFSTGYIPPNDGNGQRARDLSIVIHDTPNATSGAGPKMLCIDLAPRRVTLARRGYVNPTPDGLRTIFAGGFMNRAEDGSTATSVRFFGLRPEFTYPSHVHASPCTGVSNGGPHYVRDVACLGSEGDASVGCEATADTEFWSGFTSDAFGSGVAAGRVPHLARAGAQSLVLHDCLDASGQPTTQCVSRPRIACVDFF